LEAGVGKAARVDSRQWVDLILEEREDASRRRGDPTDPLRRPTGTPLILVSVEPDEKLARHVNGNASLRDPVPVPLRGQAIQVLKPALQAEDGVHDPHGWLAFDFDRHGHTAHFILYKADEGAEEVDEQLSPIRGLHHRDDGVGSVIVDSGAPEPCAEQTAEKLGIGCRAEEIDVLR